MLKTIFMVHVCPLLLSKARLRVPQIQMSEAESPLAFGLVQLEAAPGSGAEQPCAGLHPAAGSLRVRAIADQRLE